MPDTIHPTTEERQALTRMIDRCGYTEILQIVANLVQSDETIPLEQAGLLAANLRKMAKRLHGLGECVTEDTP